MDTQKTNPDIIRKSYVSTDTVTKVLNIIRKNAEKERKDIERILRQARRRAWKHGRK